MWQWVASGNIRQLSCIAVGAYSLKTFFCYVSYYVLMQVEDSI